MLKTCSEDQMPPPTPEDKVLLSHLSDDTKKLPAPADMMSVLAPAEDGMLQHMTCSKDGSLLPLLLGRSLLVIIMQMGSFLL